MNLLISKLLHWFLFSGTLMFAAGAVADVGAAAPASEPTPSAPSGDSSTATATTGETTSPTTEAAPSLNDAVKRAVENAEKSLAKPGVPAEVPTTEAPKTEAAKPADGTAETPKDFADQSIEAVVIYLLRNGGQLMKEAPQGFQNALLYLAKLRSLQQSMNMPPMPPGGGPPGTGPAPTPPPLPAGAAAPTPALPQPGTSVSPLTQ